MSRVVRPPWTFRHLRFAAPTAETAVVWTGPNNAGRHDGAAFHTGSGLFGGSVDHRVRRRIGKAPRAVGIRTGPSLLSIIKLPGASLRVRDVGALGRSRGRRVWRRRGDAGRESGGRRVQRSTHSCSVKLTWVSHLRVVRTPRMRRCSGTLGRLVRTVGLLDGAVQIEGCK